ERLYDCRPDGVWLGPADGRRLTYHSATHSGHHCQILPSNSTQLTSRGSSPCPEAIKRFYFLTINAIELSLRPNYPNLPKPTAHSRSRNHPLAFLPRNR